MAAATTPPVSPLAVTVGDDSLRCYRRRTPETTVLHRVVNEHFETFLLEAAR